MTFKRFATIDCTGSSTDEVLALQAGTPNHGISTRESGPFTTVFEVLSYQASYAGDGTYNPATSGCEPLTVIKFDATVSTKLLDAANSDIANTAVTGTSSVTVHDQATVTLTPPPSGSVVPDTLPTPSGSVTFKRFGSGDRSGTGRPESGTLSGGLTMSSPFTLTAQTLSYQAAYAGDANFNSASVTTGSVCEPVCVLRRQ